MARQPVVKVSWADATAYCQWLSRVTGKHFELPTEAEWEMAARGGLDQKKYPWGDEEPDEPKAWFGKEWNGYPTLKDVDYGLPNGYGLYGAAGNVYQWVADLYSAHFDAHATSRDPQGPFEGVRRVVRGGSVFDPAERVRCASRSYRFPSDRAIDVGFRVVRK
jgi:formylglycine-generating enzyme required for sulfatase activity